MDNRTAGSLKKLKGKIKETWGDLTDDEIAQYEGKAEQFLGSVQRKYGIAKEDAKKQLRAWEKECGCGSSSEAA